jgi:hypothetical protein
MAKLAGELLYRMTLEVGPPFDIGTGPRGHKLRGDVLITGGD